MVFGLFKKDQNEREFQKVFLDFLTSLKKLNNLFHNLRDDFNEKTLLVFDLYFQEVEHKKKLSKEKLDFYLKNSEIKENKRVQMHLAYNELEKHNDRLIFIKEKIEDCHKYLAQEKKLLKSNDK